MNILDALDETGKATREYMGKGRFIYLIDGDFHKDDGDGQGGFVYCNIDLLDDKWQPYHEVKEIRPENSGELWICNNNAFITYYDKGVLSFCNKYGVSALVNEYSIFSGWTRLYPLVEEDVERIEIEGVKWYENSESCVAPEISSKIAQSLLNKPPMKMTLEYTKG